MLTWHDECRLSHLSNCKWTSCNQAFSKCEASGIATHLSMHLRQAHSQRCHWNNSNAQFQTRDQLCFHLLDCHGLYSEGALPTNFHYCYECRRVFGTLLEWEAHCQDHIDNKLTLFSGIIVRFGVIVIAGSCPFCLSDTNKGTSERALQWTEGSKLNNHISKHLAGSTWPGRCPHPKCEQRLPTVCAFKNHLATIHGVEPTVSRKSPAHRPTTGVKRMSSSRSPSVNAKRMRTLDSERTSNDTPGLGNTDLVTSKAIVDALQQSEVVEISDDDV